MAKTSTTKTIKDEKPAEPTAPEEEATAANVTEPETGTPAEDETPAQETGEGPEPVLDQNSALHPVESAQEQESLAEDESIEVEEQDTLRPAQDPVLPFFQALKEFMEALPPQPEPCESKRRAVCSKIDDVVGMFVAPPPPPREPQA